MKPPARHRGTLRDTWTTVDGLRIFARVSTQDDDPETLPVVLVHGLAVSSRYMVPTAERLAPSHPVYAPDLPGFGQSDDPSHVLSIPELADVLARWMCTAGLRRAVLLGNSLGCQIIANLALRHPAMIERAVLVGPTLDPAASALREFGRLMLDLPREPPALWPIVTREYLIFGVRRTLLTFQYALSDHTLAKYASMLAPTLVVRGEHDPIVPQAWAERLTSVLPNAQLIVIPGAAHAVNFNAPVPLVRAVLRFLGG